MQHDDKAVVNCFCETTASARLWLYLKRLYFISIDIAYCISPYASFYAGLSCCNFYCVGFSFLAKCNALQFALCYRRVCICVCAYFSVGALKHFWQKVLNLKRTAICTAVQQGRFKASFFLWRRHAFKPVRPTIIRWRCQSFLRGWSSESFAGRHLENLRPDGKYRKDALEQPEPREWKTILHYWLSTSTRIWERHKKKLEGIVL